MFKVECPGCQAPYQVDERRVPAAGLRMRCPKCGNTFPVTRPGETTPTAILGEPSGQKRPERRAPAMKGTMIGLAAQADGPAAARKPAGALPTPARPSPADLPQVSRAPSQKEAAGKRGPPAGPPPRRRPAEVTEDALPAVREPRPPPREVSLPVPVTAVNPASTLSSGEGRAAIARVEAVSEPSLELPSIPVPPARPSSARKPSDSLELPSPAKDFAAELAQELEEELASDGLFGELELPSVPPQSAVASPSSKTPSNSRGVALAPSHAPKRPSSLPPANPFEDPFSLPELEAVAPEPTAKSFSNSFPGFDVPEPAARRASSEVALAASSFGDAFDAFDESFSPGSSTESIPRFDAAPEPGEAQRAGGVASAPSSATSYGEVDLGGDSAGEGASIPPSGLDTDEGMEFGAIPQESDSPRDGATTAAAEPLTGSAAVAPTAAAAVKEGPPPAARRAAPAPRAARRWLFVGAGALLLAVAGGALALLPEVGPFGIHFFSDLVQRSEHERALTALQQAAHKARATDVIVDARALLQRAESVRAAAPRHRPTAAYLAFLEYESVLRFGVDPALKAKAKVLLDGLRDSDPSRELTLARATESALNGDFEAARRALSRLGETEARSPEPWCVLGEVELAADDAAAAKRAWQRADELAPSARTAFGLARAERALGELDAARAQVTRALEQNGEHSGARLLAAELSWLSGKDAAAVQEIDGLLSAAQKLSRAEQVRARVLLGELHLGRGRLSLAEAQFAAALELDPKDVRALCGLADTFFEAGRHSAALARYEAALGSDPKSRLARLGVARAHLHLDRSEEARSSLAKLHTEFPKDGNVAFWLGRANELTGRRKEAKEAYRTAIGAGGAGDGAATAYVALAQLLQQEGSLEEAATLLEDALTALPNSAKLRKARGAVALTQGRYSQALVELEAALELDPADVGARFDMAVTHRKLNQLEQAFSVLGEVEKLDPGLPGLALERGLLLEQSGRGPEALAAYEAALAKAPDDPDLMLRVGCSRVAGGRAEAARELLAKVLEKRPRSAEAQHCLGRAFFIDGKLLEALQNLERATELDPNRAEYFVAVAMAANAAGQVAVAEQAIDAALKKDQGLGDAYWQKGVLLLRQGAAGDAVAAFDRALELRPSRHEVHADRAQAYYQLGKEVEALSEWQQALAHDEGNATWHFRYGKLLAARRLNAKALPHLLRAIELVAGAEPKPPWLWQAHQLAASASGPSAKALPHWRAFLEQSPTNAPYRDEAKQALARAGQAWSGP